MKLPEGLNINNLLKKWRLEEHLTLYLLAIAVGILGGYGAILFRLLIKASQFIFYQNSDDFLSFAKAVPFYLKVTPVVIAKAGQSPSPRRNATTVVTASATLSASRMNPMR